MNNQTEHADVKIAPPILLLLHLIAAAILSIVFKLSFGFLPAWIGYLAVVFGFGMAFSAISQFRKANTTVDPHGSVSAVVTDGPYRYSRNPIYVGLVSLLIGLPLALGSLWGFVLSPLFVVLMNQLVIQHEEAYLEKKFGEAYTSFKSRVRRWL